MAVPGRFRVSGGAPATPYITISFPDPSVRVSACAGDGRRAVYAEIIVIPKLKMSSGFPAVLQNDTPTSAIRAQDGKEEPEWFVAGAGWPGIKG
jgi:hypothetical protein